MVSQEEISLSQQTLYESASMRDDLNDIEASILLQWGEGQVARIAQDYPDDFEKKNRFLRQFIKNINRFVGQREFNELDGQKQYMSKVTMYLAELGWGHITEEMLFAALPEDKKDMFGTLRAILNLLSPPQAEIEIESAPPNDENSIKPTVETGTNTAAESIEITKPYSSTLENSNEHSITQADSDAVAEGTEDDQEES